MDYAVAMLFIVNIFLVVLYLMNLHNIRNLRDEVVPRKDTKELIDNTINEKLEERGIGTTYVSCKDEFGDPYARVPTGRNLPTYVPGLITKEVSSQLSSIRAEAKFTSSMLDKFIGKLGYTRFGDTITKRPIKGKDKRK